MGVVDGVVKVVVGVAMMVLIFYVVPRLLLARRRHR